MSPSYSLPKTALALIVSSFCLASRAELIENVDQLGGVKIPHMKRQVISDDEADSSFDVLHHLSANSPYFNSPGVGLTPEVPSGCNVSSAALFVRHTDIYANDFEYENSLQPLIFKLGNFSDKNAWARDDSLAFLVNWTSPIDNPEEQIEETTIYGREDAKAFGGLVADRYQSLMNGSSENFKVWTADADRDQETAKAFVEGFGSIISNNISLVIVDEGENQTANTLTPHESCPAFSSSAGAPALNEFTLVYATPIASRLNGIVPEFNWTATDVYAAQALCGYETVIKNESAWCSLFGEDEWLGYEYASDLLYHRELGYGAEVSPYLGMPWVSAVTRLLDGTAASNSSSNVNSSASSQNVWISFSHREEPPFVITALDLFNTTNASMPTTSINYSRAWRTSYILPFLANVALEKLSCSVPSSNFNATSNSTTSTGKQTGDYVRAVVNAAPIPIEGCGASGPGGSCELSKFKDYVEQRQALYGDFNKACGIDTGKMGNATSTLGIYEGVLPAGGEAVQVVSVSTQGNDSVEAGQGGSGGTSSAQGKSDDGSNGARGLDVGFGAVSAVLSVVLGVGMML